MSTPEPGTCGSGAGARDWAPRDAGTRDTGIPEPGAPGSVRLQKVLAAAGIGSRRACEALIDEGRVEVDGRIVREQGVRIDPVTAVVRVDGERIAVAPGQVHLMANKPRGTVSTMSDPQGRRTLADLVADRPERLFHVGRLDTDTEGLIVLTNDGDLAHRLAHPSYGVRKTYVAEITGRPPRDLGRRLRDGVALDDGPVRVDSFRVLDALATPGRGRESRTLVEVVLHEGRNRIVRRMFDAVGHPVVRLGRTHFGPLALGDLAPGRTRELTRAELAALYAAVDL